MLWRMPKVLACSIQRAALCTCHPIAAYKVNSQKGKLHRKGGGPGLQVHNQHRHNTMQVVQETWTVKYILQ